MTVARPSVALSRGALPELAGRVNTPRYDPAAVRPGIVHLGLGGFHRAHMARYTHELMDREPQALAFGIVGAGLLPADRRMHDSLGPQDWLYTLVERRFEQETPTVIGSLARVVFAAEDSTELLQAIDSPAVRIVSLTVTEHGYCLNRATKRLDPAHPLIAADLARPERPASAIGIIVEAFRRRRDSGTPPFTALTCDNIQNNGDVLRRAVLDLASLRDGALAEWIERNGAFPNSMVDRITPVTTSADIEAVRERYGIEDRWPVVCETFSQWIVEDHFVAAERPRWEEVGAQFVADVAPYEAMKLRLLNGSHLAVAGLGRLAGYAYVDEAMADPVITEYMRALMDRETGPTVPPVPGIDLSSYKRTLVERFANPAIKDTLDRINRDAPLNVLLDPIRARLQANAGVELLALALAAWLRRVRGEDETGQKLEVIHPLAPLLEERARAGGPDPVPLLSIEPLFGELGRDPRLSGPVGEWLASLYAVGAKATLARARSQLGF